MRKIEHLYFLFGSYFNFLLLVEVRLAGSRENREEKWGFFILFLFFGFLKFFLQRLISAFRLYIFYLLHYILVMVVVVCIRTYRGFANNLF